MARTGVTPSCLAIEDMADFPDLKPLKGLIPMTMAELNYPTWKMLHARRVPTEKEKAALQAYGLKYTGCAKAHIEVCKLTSEGRAECRHQHFVTKHFSSRLLSPFPSLL